MSKYLQDQVDIMSCQVGLHEEPHPPLKEPIYKRNSSSIWIIHSLISYARKAEEGSAKKRRTKKSKCLGLSPFFWKCKVRVLCWENLRFDLGSKRERKASECLLGHLTSPRNQVKASEFKGKAVRGRSKSLREATVIGEKNFGSTGRSKVFQ